MAGPPSFVTQERWDAMTPDERIATRPRAPDLTTPYAFDAADTGAHLNREGQERGFPERFLRDTLGLSKHQWNAMSEDDHERAVAQVISVLRPPFPAYLENFIRNTNTEVAEWRALSEAERERRALAEIRSNRRSNMRRMLKYGETGPPSFVTQERWENMTREERRAVRPQAPDTLTVGFVARTLGVSREEWERQTPDEEDQSVAEVVAVLQPPYPEYFQAMLRELGVSEFRWANMPEAERERMVLAQRRLKRPVEGFDYRALWVRLNRPSPAKFHAELRRRGIASPGVEFLRKELIGDESAKQVFAPPPRYRGHVYAPTLNSRWVADVMFLRGGKAWHYALVVQDIFSRYAWVEEIDSPTTAYEGFRKILERAAPNRPRELVTDKDVGFTSQQFADVLRDRRPLYRRVLEGEEFDVKPRDIVHTYKAARNDIATVDRLIYALKRAMAVERADTGRGWEATLQEAVRGYNESGTKVLYGSAPEDVSSTPALIFDRQWDESHAMRDNSRQIAARHSKLNEAGGYRVLLKPRAFGRRRVGDPVWGREVHPFVWSHQGFVDGYPTKEVLAVQRASLPLAPGQDRLDHHAREVLAPYAEYLKDRMDGPISFARAKLLLVERAGSEQQLLNVYREARVRVHGLVPTLVRVYPDEFRMANQKVSLV